MYHRHLFFVCRCRSSLVLIIIIICLDRCHAFLNGIIISLDRWLGNCVMFRFWDHLLCVIALRFCQAAVVPLVARASAVAAITVAFRAVLLHTEVVA